MEKKLIQDIIPNNKKSIRLIQKDDVRKPDVQKVEQKEILSSVQKPIDRSQEFVPKKKIFFDDDFEPEEISKKSHMVLWIISIAAVATLLFVFSLIFATATVTITPKTEPIILNDTYTINASSSVPGLHYQVLTVQKTLSQSLTTNGEQAVQKQAIGEATIYNAYSSASQRLINNTRLKTSDGLIYRIRSSVTVPGMTVKSGVQTPGSVQVQIIADLPGDQYNMKVSDLKGDFTIPGFLGTPEYKGFYARLSGDAVGGFIGTAKTVDPTVLSAGRQTVINTLKTDLIQEIYATTSVQNTLFKDNYFMQVTDLPDVSDDSQYTISEQATLYAIVFRADELSEFIAKDKIADLGSSTVDVLWNDDVVATTTGITATPWNESSLQLKITGDANAVWTYDAAKIVNEIAGKDKSVLQDILTENVNSLNEIEATIRPEWKTTFPDSVKKITIIDSVRDKDGK
jgi:hypothetical protein